MPSKVTTDVAYGFSQAFLGINKEIIARRNPTTADKAAIGTPWINKVNNTYYVCTSITNNAAFWAAGAAAPANLVTAGFITAGTALTSGTTLTVGTTATIGTGLTVTAGGATITAGGLTVTAGGITLPAGDITLAVGDLNLTQGDINIALDLQGIQFASGGNLFTSGADYAFVAAAGGDFELTLGDDAGVNQFILKDSAGATVFQVNSNGLVIVDTDVVADQLLAANDTGGIALMTTFTNGVNGDPIAAGVGTVKMTTVNAADNAGWIKIYVGINPVWIPYWNAEVA